MASDPVFASTPVVGMAQVSTANTNRDGTGTLVDVLTGGTNGTRITLIRVVATGTTTAGAVRIFLYDGTNTHLLKELLVTAVTPSTSVEVWWREYLPTGLILPNNNWAIRAATNNAETFNIFIYGGNI